MLSDQVIIQTDGFGVKKQKYIKKQRIGSGGFAKCYVLVNTRTQEKLAAKIIDKCYMYDQSARCKIYQQIQIHKYCYKYATVKYYDAFQFQQQVYILMQFCQNNTLKQFIRTRIRITQFEAKCYMHQIVDGLKHLHDKNIIHRDIKLGNLFLNFKMQVKIGDFGLSKELKSKKQKRYTTCGTPNYIAPQILKQVGHSFEADIWALGIILYAMLFGKPPFQSQSVQQTYQKIKTNNYQFPKQIPISNQAKNLIKSLLDPNPKTRISLTAVKSHDFLNRNLQNIPKSMPCYTISIPPQANYLKQYVNERAMKLQILPIRVQDNKKNKFNKLQKHQKFSRVVSADKKMLLRIFESASQGKQISSLNKGRYQNLDRHQILIKKPKTKLKMHRCASSVEKNKNMSIYHLNSLILKQKQLKEHKPSNQAENIKYEPNLQQQDINQIICYYDASDKYGVAYLLSNGNVGVIFNDQTSITSIIQRQSFANQQKAQLRDQKKQLKQKYLYYNKSPSICQKLAMDLSKKQQIFNICQQKLKQYRQNNILIPYASYTYVKKHVKLNEGFIMKLSNGIMQFFWQADTITLRNYKWIKWRINSIQGQAQLSQANLPNQIQQKVQQVKSFLLQSCLANKTKKQKNI